MSLKALNDMVTDAPDLAKADGHRYVAKGIHRYASLRAHYPVIDCASLRRLFVGCRCADFNPGSGCCPCAERSIFVCASVQISGALSVHFPFSCDTNQG